MSASTSRPGDSQYAPLPHETPRVSPRMATASPRTDTPSEAVLDCSGFTWHLSNFHGHIYEETPKFQTVIGGVIFVNSILIGLETDVEWWGWWWIELALLQFYILELVLRLRKQGWSFFRWSNVDVSWNLLDFSIIATSVACLVIPIGGAVITVFVSGGVRRDATILDPAEERHLMMLARTVRIFKILRIVKLVKVVEPLYLLVTGMLKAVQGVFWVLVLTVALLYAMGIMMTRLIGHGMIMPSDFESESLHKYFASVPSSMFILFRMMSGAASDDEMLAVDDLMSHMPMFKFVFVFFMVSSSWTVLSILTAVVSENMIHNTEEHDTEMAIIFAEEKRQRRIADLTSILRGTDVDGDGVMSERELARMLDDKDLAMRIAACCTGLPVRDIRDVFEAMQLSYVEGVPLDAFVLSLVDIGRPVTEKSIMKVDARIFEMEKMNQNLNQLIYKKEISLEITMQRILDLEQDNRSLIVELSSKEWPAKADVEGLIRGQAEHREHLSQALAGLHARFSSLEARVLPAEKSSFLISAAVREVFDERASGAVPASDAHDALERESFGAPAPPLRPLLLPRSATRPLQPVLFEPFAGLDPPKALVASLDECRDGAPRKECLAGAAVCVDSASKAESENVLLAMPVDGAMPVDSASKAACPEAGAMPVDAPELIPTLDAHEVA